MAQHFPTTRAHQGQRQGAGSLLPTSKRLTGGKVSLGLRKLNWTQVGGYLSSLWPAVVSRGSTPSNKAQNSLPRVNYWAQAFGNSSNVLGLNRLRRIEQKRKRRGNQAPLGMLFEATERQGWSLRRICKEAVRSFVPLKGTGREMQGGGQETPSGSAEW